MGCVEDAAPLVSEQVVCHLQGRFEHFQWKAARGAEISPDLGPSLTTRWHIFVLPSVLHAIYFWELDSGTLGNALSC